MVANAPLTSPKPAQADLQPTARLRQRAVRPRLLTTAAVLIAFLSVVPSPATAQDQGRPLAAVIAGNRTHARWGSSDQGIQLGLAFEYNATNTALISQEVSFIFGGYFVDWNFGVYPSAPPIEGFIPFDVDPFPPANPGHSLIDWQATHPDWIVYQCDGKTPAYSGSGNTYVPLDFGNPAVRTWQVQQAATMLRAGVKGISVDDFNFTNYAGRCGVYRNGVWTRLGYPGRGGINARYTADMVSWLADFSSQLKQEFPTSTIAVNTSPSISGLRAIETITPYIDTDFDEAGFTDYGAHNLSGSAWLQEVKAIQYLNHHGKGIDVNGIVHAFSDGTVSHTQLNWVLANYLLVKGKRTYTYVYAGNRAGFALSPSDYGSFYDRRAYHVPIGHSISPIVRYDGVYARGYSGGLTIVNPSPSQTYTVALGGTYRDMFGRRYQSVTLAPTRAIVLLSSSSKKTGASKRTG